jgi:hypothetical protein
MVKYLCDLCGGDIPRREEIRVVALGFGPFSGYTFCPKCAAPIILFLRKRNLRTTTRSSN